MTKRALKALKGSICKWTAIINGGRTDRGPVDCPLCKLYYKHFTCSSACPVVKAVGNTGCVDTPYGDWVDHQRIAHYEILNKRCQCPKCKVLAGKELTFLHSLQLEAKRGRR